MSVESDIANLQDRVADLEDWEVDAKDDIRAIFDSLTNHQNWIDMLYSDDRDHERRIEALEKGKNRTKPAIEKLVDILAGKGALTSREVIEIMNNLAPEETPIVPEGKDILSGQTIYAKVEGAPEPYPYDSLSPATRDVSAPRTVVAQPAVVTPIVDESAAVAASKARAQQAAPLDLSQVVWLHTDVSGWSERSPLKLTLSSKQIGFAFTEDWPTASDGLSADVWVFVNRSNVWYGGVWASLRPGQRTLSRDALQGPNIDANPLRSWRPISGVRYHFLVSGRARGDVRTVQERTSVVSLVWP